MSQQALDTDQILVFTGKLVERLEKEYTEREEEI